MSAPVAQALLETARWSPDATALVTEDGEQSLSYGVLASWAGACAARLVSAGVANGDPVAIYLDKTIESVVALYAAWATGAVVVPIHGASRARQVDHIVGHSGATVIVTDAVRRAGLSAAIQTRVNAIEVPSPPVDEAVTFSPRAMAAGDLAAILYTSGSSGLPKGIAVSHANLEAGTRIVAEYLAIDSRDRILSVLPFSFDYGLNQLLTAVAAGATLVLQQSTLAGDVCRSLARHRITGLAGVPPLWAQLTSAGSPFVRAPLPALRYLTNSGGAVPLPVVEQLRKAQPQARLFLMYGLTEAFRSTYLPPEELDRRPTSMGRAIPETEVFVVDEHGQPCGIDEIGELVHRGPTVALGYWRDAEATAERFRPDPRAPNDSARVVYSGDLVRRDADGFLYYVGRRDEQIKTQGMRVSPTEVELAIVDSGLVEHVVVGSAPDPVAGAVIVAHCVPRSTATFSADAVIRYCRRELPEHMVPRSVVVASDFPRTATGKIDRRAVLG